MIIKELTLRNFRCFDEKKITFDNRMCIIQGQNGSGKSSILEGLHYLCYLKSFRTHVHRELIEQDRDFFFIHADFYQELEQSNDSINVGYSSAEGKVVKYNQSPIQSYKELIDHFKIVTLAEHDLELVQGMPEYRRDFLNYALLLDNPGLLTHFKRYKQILQQRNSLLSMQQRASSELETWTEKLWQEAAIIRHQRSAYLSNLERLVNDLLKTYFFDDDIDCTGVSFIYQAKYVKENETFEEFWSRYAPHIATEYDWKRSLFGIHLDDFSIIYQSKKARCFASRGQQKLLILLMKIAQLQQVSSGKEPGVLMLDDFMTDFDHGKVEKSIKALGNLPFQVILSCPIDPQFFLKNIKTDQFCHIKL